MRMKSELAIEVRKVQDGVVVEATGEIDISNIDDFKEAMGRAAEMTDGGVSVDLCGLRFIDTAGLAELVVAAKRLKALDKTLQVMVKESGQPEYVLKTTGLDVILDICYPEAQ